MIQGVLLAAGSSVRFGADKLLCARIEGRPMIEWSAASLAATLPQVWAVVATTEGPVAERLRSLGFQLVCNVEPGRGLGASIAAGVAATAEGRGCLIALGDMPWVAQDSIRAVADAVEAGAEIAAPFYRGRRGHPVGFGPQLRQALLGLTGEPGARSVLERYADALVQVPVTDPGVLADVDTPADLPSHRRGR